MNKYSLAKVQLIIFKVLEQQKVVHDFAFQIYYPIFPIMMRRKYTSVFISTFDVQKWSKRPDFCPRMSTQSNT